MEELDPDLLIKIKARLSKFMTDMNGWEINCVKMSADVDCGLLDGEAAKRVIREGFLAILAENCLPTADKRRVEHNTYSFQEPPEYDPQMEPIVDISRSGKSFVVETRQLRGLKARHLYNLVCIGNEVKIKSKKYIMFDGSKMSRRL